MNHFPCSALTRETMVKEFVGKKHVWEQTILQWGCLYVGGNWIVPLLRAFEVGNSRVGEVEDENCWFQRPGFEA
jgi:hypothetical protein